MSGTCRKIGRTGKRRSETIDRNTQNSLELNKQEETEVLLEGILDCVWNNTADQDSLPCASDIAGRRRACLAAVDSFLDAVDRQTTEELLYCRCDGLQTAGKRSSAVARACLATMGALRPACSVVELPPPSCADVLQRCLADSSCRSVGLQSLCSLRRCYYGIEASACTYFSYFLALL